MKNSTLNSHFQRTQRWLRKSPVTSSCRFPPAQATPAPPVGPALGQHGVNIMEFCKTFNARTQGQQGLIIPVVITVFSDRSFTFITKTPPAAILLLKAAGIPKGSGVPNKTKVGKRHAQAGRRDRQDQDARPERGVARSGRQDRRGDGAVDGNRSYGVARFRGSEVAR